MCSLFVPRIQIYERMQCSVSKGQPRHDSDFHVFRGFGFCSFRSQHAAIDQTGNISSFPCSKTFLTLLKDFRFPFAQIIPLLLLLFFGRATRLPYIFCFRHVDYFFVPCCSCIHGPISPRMAQYSHFRKNNPLTLRHCPNHDKNDNNDN